MARSNAMGSASMRWATLLCCLAALACNGGGSSGDGGGSGDAGGTAGDGSASASAGDGGSADGGSADGGSADGGGSASADGGTGGSDGGTGAGTGGVDCDPVGPWNDPPAGPILISKRPDGAPATGGAVGLSGDGRYIAFASMADPTSTMPGGGLLAIYIYDAVCDTITPLPYEPPTDPVTESLDPVLSDDGGTIVFATRDADQVGHIFVADLAAGTFDPLDADVDGNVIGTSNWHYEASSDGRFIAFHVSSALVPEDTNGNLDVYVLDRDTGDLELICPPDPMAPNAYCSMPSISGDGGYVAYERNANAYVYDRMTGVEEEVSQSPAGSNDSGGSGAPSISDDGNLVAFHSDKRDLVDNDNNATTDIFVRDRSDGSITRVSVDADGVGLEGPSAIPEISADGNRIVFVMGWYGAADPQAQIYAHDRPTGTTWMISQTAAGEVASAASSLGKISADGMWAGFETTAQNLLPNDMPAGGWDAFAVALSVP